MRRKNIKLLLVISVCMLAVTAAIFGSLNWDKKIQLSGAEATQMLENEGIVIRTVDTSKLVNGEAEVDRNNGASNGDDTAVSKEEPLTEGKAPTSEDTGNKNDKDPKLSLTEIKQQYTGELLSLETEISSGLEAILDAAIADFREKRANNEEINARSFQTRLANEIRQLEVRSDQRFNEIYLELEKDLVANGFAKNEATPFRAQYRAEKDIRERKALERLANLE